jgi:hypothetical protein
VDGVLVGAGSLWPTRFIRIVQLVFNLRQCCYDGQKYMSLKLNV